MQPCVRLLIDEVDFANALQDVYTGLTFLSLACTTLGLIKPLPYPENEEAIYRARFKLFEKVVVPQFIKYEKFVEDRKRILDNQEAPDMLNSAKHFLMEGKATLARMAEVPVELRNGEHYSKEYLEKLMKLIVRNSLNIAKVQMMTIGGKQLP